MPQLRLLHIAICLSAVAVTLAFGWLRSTGIDGTAGAPALISWVLIGFAAMIILSAATMRARISPVRAGAPDDGWVSENKTRAVILWVMLEGGAALCGVALFLGADPWIAGALAAGSLGFLVSQSPGTLAGH